MKIWISIGHPAQLNFYLNSIRELSKRHKIFVTVLDRGKLLRIAGKELNESENLKIIPMGRHSGSKFSAVWEANFINFFKMISFFIKHRPQIAIGNGFLHGVVGKFLGANVIMFSDDIERKIPRLLMKRFSDELYYVTGSDKDFDDSSIQTFKSLKEWAYLAPKYFKPDIEKLKPYGLLPDNYIFVREVITGTLNYSDQSSNLIASVSNRFPKGVPVLLSLEDKSKVGEYPDDWILLKEPIDGIHSLIYFSKALVSSGDSMAREGSILGVPSIYCGIREMKANQVMIDRGKLFHLDVDEVPTFLENEMQDDDRNKKELFRNKLDEDWIDVPDFIKTIVNSYERDGESDDQLKVYKSQALLESDK